MEDTGHNTLTDAEQEILDFLIELHAKGIHPTLRSATDRYQTAKFGSKRLTERQMRYRLEGLESKGQATQYDHTTEDGELQKRWQPAV